MRVEPATPHEAPEGLPPTEPSSVRARLKARPKAPQLIPLIPRGAVAWLAIALAAVISFGYWFAVLPAGYPAQVDGAQVDGLEVQSAPTTPLDGEQRAPADVEAR